MRVYAYVCACVHVYVHMCVHVCTCTCVCVHVWRERELKKTIQCEDSLLILKKVQNREALLNWKAKFLKSHEGQFYILCTNVSY